MNLRNADWIFFDLGYTLVDETGEQRRRARIAIDESVRNGSERISIEEFERLALEFGRKGGSPFSDVCKKIGASYVKYSDEGESAYPDAAEVLSKLSSKYKLGVIANQLPGAADRLRRFGLSDHISLVFSSAEFGVGKPDKAIFLAALSAAGCAPERAVMVGDRPDNDVRPARALGMMTVRIRQGQFIYFSPDDPSTHPDAEVTSLSELLPLFGL